MYHTSEVKPDNTGSQNGVNRNAYRKGIYIISCYGYTKLLAGYLVTKVVL